MSWKFWGLTIQMVLIALSFASKRAAICIWVNFQYQLEYSNDIGSHPDRNRDMFTIWRQSIWNRERQSK